MGVKGIAVATLFLMAMVITVNSQNHKEPQVHDEIYHCYKKCSGDCFHNKKMDHKCFLDCHHKCLGFMTAHPLQYCSLGCSMTHCSKFMKDASKQEDCEKSCSKYCEHKG